MTLNITRAQSSSGLQIHRILDEALGLEAYIAVDEPGERLTFGGLRVAPSVTSETMARLARGMTQKFAIHGVPIGGAKAGIRCTAEHAHKPEVIRAFAIQAAALLKSNVILGKDLGATDGLLDQCYAALGVPQLHLAHARGLKTAPNRIRDLTGYRSHMTGCSVAWSVDTALSYAKIKTAGARVIIQGSGRVGLGSAVRLAELGARLVGISDREGGIYWADGLPVERLSGLIDSAGTINRERCDFPHQQVDRDALLGMDGDAVVFAADSNLVTESIAATVRAPVLAEGANAALLPAADELLFKKGHWVVPDVVANSSSAALVGHQIAAGNTLEPEAVWRRIEQTLRRVTAEILDASRKNEKPTREVLNTQIKTGQA
jgi:glutamate dehydrogenase (NAD(P)+)